MALRTYWCVLFRADQKRSGKIVFTEADNSGFSLDLDLGGEQESQLRGALMTAVQQAGGDVSDLSWYRMDVYDSGGEIAVSAYTVPPSGAAWPPSEGLAGWTDDQLLGELARRLGGQR
jgi:hypothetical protein